MALAEKTTTRDLASPRMQVECKCTKFAAWISYDDEERQPTFLEFAAAKVKMVCDFQLLIIVIFGYTFKSSLVESFLNPYCDCRNRKSQIFLGS
jgi:hypothetical protein